MKSTILLPVRFLFILICLTAGLSLLYCLVGWGTSYRYEESFGFAQFIWLFIQGGTIILPVAICISIIISLYVLLKDPGIKILSFLFLFLTSSILMFVGVNISAALSERFVLHALSPSYPIPERVFHAVESDFVYTLGDTKLLHVDVDGKEIFEVNLKASWGPDSNVLKFDDGSTLSTIPDTEAFNNIFRVPGYLQKFIQEMIDFHSQLVSYAGWSSLPLAHRVGVICFFFTCVWLIVRLTRWPLFNFLLLVLVFRYFLLFYEMLNSPLVLDIAALYLPAFFMPFVSSAVILLIAFLMLLTNLLVMPYSDWKREMFNE